MIRTRSLTRRTMLQTSGLTVAALTLPLPSLATAAVPALRAPRYLRRSSYLGFTGARFSAAGTPLTLIAVGDLAGATGNPALRDHDEAFTLRLEGPASQPLPAGIHELVHPEHGACLLFLSPVGRPDATQRYDVVIDRTVPLPAGLEVLEPALDQPAPATPAPAVRAAAVGGAAVAPATAPAAAAARRADPIRRIRVRASAKRSARKVQLELRFPGDNVQAVRVELRRKGRTYARGTAAVRRGRATLALRRVRPVRLARHDLVLTITDRRGNATTIERSVKVR